MQFPVTNARVRPLISPQSPSYERAWHEFLHHGSGENPPALVALISRLGEAEQNAQEVCSRLVASLRGDPLALVIADRALLHDARRHALEKLVQRLGGAERSSAEVSEVLTRASAEARQAHSHAAALRVLTLLQKELRAEYDAVVQSELLDADQRSALLGLAPPEQA